MLYMNKAVQWCSMSRHDLQAMQQVENVLQCDPSAAGAHLHPTRYKFVIIGSLRAPP